MKLILALPTFGLLCTGFLGFTRMNDSAAVSQPIGPEPALVESTHPKMWAADKTIYKDETLVLHFSAPNPTFMGVVNPDGKFFYVIFPKASAMGKLQPFVSSEAFAKMEVLNIPTGTFTADPYIYGVFENQPVFTKSGTYRFILGEDLHTDDPSTVYSLSIQYHHTARPATAAVVVVE